MYKSELKKLLKAIFLYECYRKIWRVKYRTRTMTRFAFSTRMTIYETYNTYPCDTEFAICFDFFVGRDTTVTSWKSVRVPLYIRLSFFSPWKHMFTFSCGSLAPQDNDLSTRAEQPSRATVFS